MTPTAIRSALWLPLFDELADPLAVARLAAEAEEVGWDGVFVWDHVRWREPVEAVADPWITLAAVASATERIRLGPMVTPLARRRPVKLARETATLDRAQRRAAHPRRRAGHRPVRPGVLARPARSWTTGPRGQMLDESLAILTAAWSGEPVHHHGEHYTVDGIRFLPRPVQRPGVPVWAAGFPGNVPAAAGGALRRVLPGQPAHPDEVAGIAAELAQLRERDTPFDIAVACRPAPTPRRTP